MHNLSIMDSNDIGTVIMRSIFTFISTLEAYEATIVNNYQIDNIYAYIEANCEK